ncbi:MAG: hypothetical protein Tsb0034_19830 [Ekhidna sp.]
MKTVILIALVALLGCKNRDINEGEAFRPRPVRDNFDDSHFTKVTIDGVEYLMMERDNNNPHEGFGFMAFRANKMLEKQDSIISYLRAMQFYQNKMYARMFNISEEEAQKQFGDTFKEYLYFENRELEELEKEELKSNANP